ncbi:unnamed protein product, partial [Musa banksii]
GGRLTSFLLPSKVLLLMLSNSHLVGSTEIREFDSDIHQANLYASSRSVVPRQSPKPPGVAAEKSSIS